MDAESGNLMETMVSDGVTVHTLDIVISMRLADSAFILQLKSGHLCKLYNTLKIRFNPNT